MAASPAQPAAPKAVPGNKSATVTWTAPVNNGSAITSYTVTSLPGEFTCTTSTLTCVVNGLSNETSYTFSVTATNGLGTSVRSPESSPTTPTHTPRLLTTQALVSGQSSAVAYSSDGRYAIWGTETAPAQVVKYDLETKTVVETLTLDSASTAIRYASASDTEAFFFYSGGYVAIDIDGMFVTKSGTWSSRNASTVVDSTGSYIYTAANWNVSDARSWVRKFDATTGALVSEYAVYNFQQGELVDILMEGTYLYVAGQQSSNLYLHKIDLASMTKVGTTLTVYQGKTGYNYGSVRHQLHADGITSMMVFSSDDQFSSFSGNLVHVARLDLSQMTLGQIKTTDNGSDALLTYSAASWDQASGYGYAFNRSTLSSDGFLHKIRISDLSIVATQSFATKPTVAANAESMVFSTIYDSRVFTFSKSTSSGFMREYALGDVANAPTGLTAVYGDEQASLTWTTPTDLGVATDVSFEVTSSVGDFGCLTTELNCVVTGLTNGTSYVFKVTAINSGGVGVASSPTSVTPKRVPDAPTGLVATYGPARATLTWTAPANNGGASISSYKVVASPGGQFCTSATATCVLTGLTNGTAYTFTVTATNVVGTSVSSDVSNSVTPRSAPSIPRSVNGSFGNTTATVSWDIPSSDGASPITGYRVTSVPASQTCNTDPDTFTCNFTGLTNGTTYQFFVYAINAEGSSAGSSSVAITPATYPGAPAAPSITSAGNASISLSWNAPSNNGGSAPTGYTVTSSPGGQTCVTTGATVCTVSGLTNGTSYTFTVTATNVAGTSVASPASASSIPRTKPSAPGSFLATYGNTTVTLTWDAPTSNGGLPITSYKVTTVGSTKTCTALEPTRVCTITGLVNGTSYTFSATATNEAGLVSVASASSVAVPKTTPGIPRSVSLTASNTSIKVNWVAPTSNGGSAITTYRATTTPGSFSCTSSGTTCTIPDLVNGTSYSVKVAAYNVVGAGIESSALTAEPNVVPDAPTGIYLETYPARLYVSWTAPTPNGGTPVLVYRATATPGNSYCEVAAPTTYCDITGLVNGTSYTVKVSAKNALGTGTESVSSSVATPRDVPYAPNAPTATVGDGQLTLNWVAPVDGGSPILDYQVTEVSDSNKTCIVSAPTTSCVIDGLANGVEYSFKVTARNELGSSLLSAASLAKAPVGPPSAPTFNELRYANGSISLSWNAPIANGGAPILGYVITAQPGGKTCTTDQLNCVITGLTNGTSYTFTAKSRNSYGLGAASLPSTSIAPWSVPSAPTGIRGTPFDGVVVVSWNAPVNTDFDSTSYVVTSVPGGFSCEVTGDTSCSVTDLDNGTAYTFSVVATNYSGSSSASLMSAPATPRTSPDAPQKVIPRVISTGIEVNWIAPDFNGGANISFYTATAQPGDQTCVSSTTSCVIKGLTRGMDYTFTVTATNVAGTSYDSEPIDPIVFGAVPSKPNSVFAIAGAGSATVSWSAPQDNGGSEIAYYVAESTPGGFMCVVEGQSCVITGLTNGTKYTFTVRAANGFGESDNSILTAPISPVAKPGQPSIVESAFISYDRLLVNWTAASGNVSYYKVILQEPNYPYSEIDSATVSSATLTYTFDGLNTGSAYRVQVITFGLSSEFIRAASAPARNFGPVIFTQYPSVVGSPTVGKSLVASDGFYLGNPAPKLTRSWYRCSVVQAKLSPLTKDCVAIKGATSDSYKLTALDYNKFIAFGVTATNDYGAVVAYGVVTGKVASAPIASKLPTIAGVAKSAKSLKSTLGNWTGSPGITYKYQWVRCTATYKASITKGLKCVAIAKATKSTYTLTAADVGKYVRLVVTATNKIGKSEAHTATTGKVSK